MSGLGALTVRLLNMDCVIGHDPAPNRPSSALRVAHYGLYTTHIEYMFSPKRQLNRLP